MFKTKGLIVGLVVLLAVSLPAPSAQASELVKLGKLLVTGKRAPSTDAKPVADKPAAPRTEPSAPSAERQAAQQQAATRLTTEAAEASPTGYDWAERQGVESSRMPATDSTPRAGAERVGRSPAPQQNMEPVV
jgi:hypothetical protein